jgi:signal peptidase II
MRWRFTLPFLLLVSADQGSKAWARTTLAGGPRPVLGDAVSFRLGLNPGMAFSLLPHAGLVLSLVGLAVTAFIVYRVVRRPAHLVPLALIAAGALGNAVDRLAHGVVTDFVVVRVAGFTWPTFNVADAALVVGVVLLALRPAARVPVSPRDSA